MGGRSSGGRNRAVLVVFNHAGMPYHRRKVRRIKSLGLGRGLPFVTDGHEHAANIGVAGGRGYLRDSPGTAELSAAIWLSAGAAAAISPAATAGVSSSATNRTATGRDRGARSTGSAGRASGCDQWRSLGSQRRFGRLGCGRSQRPAHGGRFVSVGPTGSAELQLDYANFVRLCRRNRNPHLRLSKTAVIRFRSPEDLITYRVLRDSDTQSEISTPAVAVRPVHASAVRVEVAPDGVTRIIVRHGDADVSTSKGTEHIHEGNMMLVRGSRGRSRVSDRLCAALGTAGTTGTISATRISSGPIKPLSEPGHSGRRRSGCYGRWGYDPAYGNVWTPNVAPSGLLIGDGQWVWEDYYGWTWVDYASRGDGRPFITVRGISAPGLAGAGFPARGTAIIGIIRRWLAFSALAAASDLESDSVSEMWAGFLWRRLRPFTRGTAEAGMGGAVSWLPGMWEL